MLKALDRWNFELTQHLEAPLGSRHVNNHPLWRRWHCLCVVLLVTTIPDLATSGSSNPEISADRQIKMVASKEKGALVFQNRCATCHMTKRVGPNTFGPNLHGLFGRQAGTLPGYNYSADLRDSRIVWDRETLSEYLADPHRGRRGDKMPYPGLSSKTDRDNLISYLEQATR